MIKVAPIPVGPLPMGPWDRGPTRARSRAAILNKMTARLLLSALLALGSAAPAAAQVRSAPVTGTGISVVPSFTPGLGTPGLGGLSGPALSAPSLAPSLIPSFTTPAPLPLPQALVPSAIAGVPSFVPAQANAVPLALSPVRSAPSAGDKRVPGSEKPASVTSLKDIHLLFDADARGADGSLHFDGSQLAPKLADPAHAAKPIGSYGVSTVRTHSASEASSFIPKVANASAFVAGLRQKWASIGWLDLRLYRDVNGNTFRAVDLSGRPELIDVLPEVQPHEAVLVRKIQMHTDDLQLVLREEAKTPDLIVGGVVTEMKSLHAEGLMTTTLENADAQLKSHSARHGLGLGAIAIDVVGAPRSWGDVQDAINEYAKDKVVGFDRVEIYQGKERRVFTPGADGKFGEGRAKKLAPSNARFLVPNAIAEAPLPDPELIAREVTEPPKRLREAGVKATVTVYGSARLLPADLARGNLDKLIKKYGGKPKDPEARRRIHDAKTAVEMSRWYEVAREFGRIVAVEGGGEVAVVTGGGPGIMEAANRGAFEAGGPSVGYNIILDKEQGLNKFVTPGLSFEFQTFATRKMSLRHGAMALVYMPGGFGTMDELFEVLTLMQTRKMKRTPIVLVGEKSYWDKIIDFQQFVDMGLISRDDLSLFRFADTAQGAWLAARTPVSGLTRR